MPSALGTASLILLIEASTNGLIWRRLYSLAETKYKLPG
jgi:hypothetical protein